LASENHIPQYGRPVPHYWDNVIPTVRIAKPAIGTGGLRLPLLEYLNHLVFLRGAELPLPEAILQRPFKV
jgi:hypothetical protein